MQAGVRIELRPVQAGAPSGAACPEFLSTWRGIQQKKCAITVAAKLQEMLPFRAPQAHPSRLEDAHPKAGRLEPTGPAAADTPLAQRSAVNILTRREMRTQSGAP